MNKKYFIYTRISDNKYENSIEDQKKMLFELARKDGLNEDDLIPLSETKSGAKGKNRDVFEDMIIKLEKDCEKYKYSPEKRKYGGVYFFKIDRLARNDESFQRIFNLLDAGYTFKSVTETIENTPTGRLLFRILSSFAIYESEKLSNRESLANIHNIVAKKFKNLGGKFLIFGYKFNKNGDIVIDQTEKEIVIKIYETFLFFKGKDKRNIYKNIFSNINQEFNGYLENYLKQNSKAPNPARFIENILKNENMIKYNGYIKRSLKINDELIKNYMDTIINKDNKYYQIEGINKIGTKINFNFPFFNLAIVNDSLYYRVKETIKKNSNKKVSKKDDFFGLFEDIIYFEKDGKLYKANPYKNNKKGTYYYRKNLNGKSYEISEKVGIENKIKASGIVDKILNISNDDIKLLKKVFDEINEEENNKNELKVINAKINIYKYFIERYETLKEHAKTKDELLNYNGEILTYKKEIKDLEEYKNLIDENSNELTERFINLFKIKSLFTEDIYTKRDFYISMFDKIIYNENKNITIILNILFTELGLPEKITI